MATRTVVDVVMPQMGVSVSEGTITRWAKQVGERIEADETIVEISTDKVDTEVPAPASGVVVELLANEGETVPVNTRIAVIATESGGGGDAPAEAAPAPEAVSAPPPAAASAAPTAPAQAGTFEGEGRSFISPVVARMLAEHQIDIGRIPGTGRGGRVTKKDVQAFIDGGQVAAAPEVHDRPHFSASLEDAIVERPAAPEPPVPATAPAPAAAPAAPSAAPAAPAPAVVAEAGPGEELYQFNTIRKVIARHMRHSLDTAAHVTTVIEVDMTGVVNLRKAWKAEYQRRYGVNLTYVPFVARAAIDAIGSWPWINAEVQGESALIKRYVNLGMAVAVDDAKGLMVPVIHGAEENNLVGLSRSVSELAEKARTKTLTPDEMSGGTFTITNPGVFGALIGTPIIPEGQVAILDVEAIVKRPVVVTDAHGNDAIAIRSMMFLCLSYDHRLVDGAYAAQFMAQLKRNLETWDEQAFGL
jgi:2-oxoglutarate dehydrogenase E2 component (dihydrolipoamide succinyltransferase)